jgi:hypothetical protein
MGDCSHKGRTIHNQQLEAYLAGSQINPQETFSRPSQINSNKEPAYSEQARVSQPNPSLEVEFLLEQASYNSHNHSRVVDCLHHSGRTKPNVNHSLNKVVVCFHHSFRTKPKVNHSSLRVVFLGLPIQNGPHLYCLYFFGDPAEQCIIEDHANISFKSKYTQSKSGIITTTYVHIFD